jgi:uncharacterized membrane protein
MNFGSWLFVAFLASALLAGAFYQTLPEKMATHWNAGGIADGYSDKLFAAVLFPALVGLMSWLFYLIPEIDPLGTSIEKFRKYYEQFSLILVGFFVYLQVISIAWNLGYELNFAQFLLPAFAVLFYYAGVLCENSERTWFIGVRTPWTMMSDRVWDNTNKLGGKTLRATALVALVGAAFPEYGIGLTVALALATAVATMAYSYLEYAKENKEGKEGKIPATKAREPVPAKAAASKPKNSKKTTKASKR